VRCNDVVDENAHMQTFIFMLCQYSMKTLVSKIFNFGISARTEESIRIEDTSWGQLLADPQKKAHRAL
jgi:hypothetical protein